jgi:hypothetical protein
MYILRRIPYGTVIAPRSYRAIFYNARLNAKMSPRKPDLRLERVMKVVIAETTST